MYSITNLALKTSSVFILYGILTISFLHLYRKKFENIQISSILSLATSFLLVLTLYDFNPLNWYLEAKEVFYAIVINSGIGVELLIAPFLVGGFLVVLGNYISERLSQQEYRSFYHSIYGIMIASMLALSQNIAFLFLSISLFLLFIAEYLRTSDDTSRLTLYVKKVLNKPLRSYEKRGYIASFSYIGGMLIVILFLPQNYALASALILSLGDPAAALTGMRYGKHFFTHNPDKSLEGTLAMLLVSIIALQIIKLPVILTLFTATSAALFESLNLKASDNLLLPIMVGIVIYSLA